MQTEIKQREFQLPHGREPGVKTAGGDEARLLRRRQRLAAGEMPGDALQHVRVPGIVFHELAGQLDRIPRHAVDAGDARIVDAREHVVQPVAELVKQGHDVIVGEERGTLVSRRQEVAHQVRDRQRGARRQALAADALIHPGAAALVGTRVGIQIEAADRLPARRR